MNDPQSTPPSGERACPRCGQTFTCGLAAHQEKCWCFELPHIISMKDASREGCICPSCLQKQIDEIQAREKQANVQ